ncbi:hypothetical protein RRSWK_01942 [Rhodopirellula sp. SWK7]|nr:hypothetical protein RRSWK_01942 [Rhodopirellula sp. SWK7]
MRVVAEPIEQQSLGRKREQSATARSQKPRIAILVEFKTPIR